MSCWVNWRKSNIKSSVIRQKGKCASRKQIMCGYQGVRNVRFSENMTCFVFLKHPFWDSPFCLITNKIIKRKIWISTHQEIMFLLHWRQCYLTKFFLIQPRFPKTRTQFLFYNIARNEEGFGVLLFIIFWKQKNYL